MKSQQSEAPNGYTGVTSLEPVALDDLSNPHVTQAVAYWRSLCRGRRYPARNDLDPRALSPIQRHMILVKVTEDGADFEYRMVGELQAQAYTRPIQGKFLSELAADSPVYGSAIFAGYVYIQKTGEPFALRGWVGKDYGYGNFCYCESVTLPLGPTDDWVDHLLIFSAFAPRELIS